VNDALKQSVYYEHINGSTENEIAKKLNIHQSTVSRNLAKIKGTIEHRLSNIAITEFEQYFIEFRDAINRDIKAISDELLLEKDPERIDRLRDQRHNRRKDMWLLLGDGEAVLILRKLKQSGIIKNPTQTN